MTNHITPAERAAFETALRENLAYAIDSAVNWAAAQADISNSAYMSLRTLLCSAPASTGIAGAACAAAHRILDAALGGEFDALSPETVETFRLPQPVEEGRA